MAEFKTDIQIAQECEMENIRVIAERAGVDEKYLEMYGNYKGRHEKDRQERRRRSS